MRTFTIVSYLLEKELAMWGKEAKLEPPTLTDEEIDRKYESRDWRILTETNREQLPNFVEALKRANWIELRPFYQRRQRWDEVRQSKLIESFIMNIPVPPLFVYESEYAKYEVMDGQQRITAIHEFFSNNLRLKGLERWPELNGRTYAKLPGLIKKGIDRRSISYTVLLTESAHGEEEKFAIRRMVFERLNTGGVELSSQEVRNSLFHGKLNSALEDLSRHPLFRRAWGLPAYNPDEKHNPPANLLKEPFYSKMQDVEVVLRFFALRNVEHYRKGMKGFLDLYMLKGKGFTDSEIEKLKTIFIQTIELATDVYGDLLFRPFSKENEDWVSRPLIAFADAVMVGLCRNMDRASILVANRDKIVAATKQLFVDFEEGTFTGRGNSRADIQERIDLFDRMLKDQSME